MGFSAQASEYEYERPDFEPAGPPPNHPYVQVVPHDCVGCNEHRHHASAPNHPRCWRKGCRTNVHRFSRIANEQLKREAFLAFPHAEIVLCQCHQNEAAIQMAGMSDSECAEWLRKNLERPQPRHDAA
ncbi:MAG: hypothetical protein HYT22_03565 [Candidatus Niyogibacteria bacterium]|nr:hypothetical protein [Candidatus Niyogibacteria bacterium]